MVTSVQNLKSILHLFHLSDHPSLAFHCLVFVWHVEVFGPSHSFASRWQLWPPPLTSTMLKSLSSTAASTPALNCPMKSLTTTTARPDSLSARALKLLQVSRLRWHKTEHMLLWLRYTEAHKCANTYTDVQAAEPYTLLPPWPARIICTYPACLCMTELDSCPPRLCP